jgi:outer membrane protein TolC
MSRNPAGAVFSPAYQRIECFCRTRLYPTPLRWLLAGLLLLAPESMVPAQPGPSRTPSPSPSPALSPVAFPSPTVSPEPSAFPDASVSPEPESAAEPEFKPTIPSEASAPPFTLNDAIQFAFQHNPNILAARQEILRTKGVLIEVRAQAIPHLDAAASWMHTDPNLRGGNRSTIIALSTPPTATPPPGGTPFPSATPILTVGTVRLTDNSYDLTLTASQLLYNGSTIPAIKGAAFARDASIFALRDTIDRVIALVRQQFYQVILNRSLIGVQEESVHLLEQQLEDQQNRFEAGTVPRFNVLQAEVALANQQPQLITARNNYRIAQLQLAKTIGLDYNPQRRTEVPLRCIGELSYQEREIPLPVAVELGKERRPLLKQQRANVLAQVEAVHGAWGGFQPIISANAAYEWQSATFSDSLSDLNKGWFFGFTGTWPIFDGLATVGRIKQQNALLKEARITYDDAVRQVELEVQQAYSNLQQDRELYFSQSKNVDQAREALRLARARLAVGAGVQLDVLNAQVQLTQAQSTRLSALYSYNADLAEFDRATATDTVYHAGLGLKSETRLIKTDVRKRTGVESSGK